ncbi:DUF4225 domain-containing protein [Paramixta manurensis]|uniref:DUF4225 domain-containing protein n=1 Tax=Paramixta manurensis TaxID=2740817 RepID=A0A6M8UDN5_9GAMM|nr:DUF4225 domain-containing protein [Erwiniaceae bacterium PD-1]
MDTFLLSGGRNQAWSETMVNLEARKLVNTANKVASAHLQDGLTRMGFMREIKDLIDQQFANARRAKTDEECLLCIRKLREENDNLQDQERLLRMRTAQLMAKVELVRENNKIVGYVISAVHIVISGVAAFGGIAMMSSMTPVGVLAGATLFIDGLNGISKEVDHLRLGDQSTSEGVFADGTIELAKFMGFTSNQGLAFYKTVTLGASVWSIFGLARKPAAWRLFRWLPKDYYRKVDTMSRPKLTMKIITWGIKAKVIFDLSEEASPD